MTLRDIMPMVQGAGIRDVLIIDDAYDDVPLAAELEASDARRLASVLARSGSRQKKRLAAALTAAGHPEDDYVAGFELDGFAAALYGLYSAGKLPKKDFAPVFAPYEAEKEQKRLQLAVLEAMMDGLALRTTKQGRLAEPIEHDVQLVFLDLYLGVTGREEALDEAADRIRALLERGSSKRSPLIVLMSTKDGPQLAPLARLLRDKAGLLGCKFRPVNKDEFEVAVPRALRELLTRFDDGEAIERWLDAWSRDIDAARIEFLDRMRALDLSDLAYLVKYRLEVEGMQLDSYLRTMSASFLQYCIERQAEVAAAEPALRKMNFAEMPPAHFLPSPQVPLMRHASTFVAEPAIDREPLPSVGAARALQLGDLIVQRPKRRGSDRIDPGGSTPVWVVISQACDIVQGKADTILLLRGQIQPRNWMIDYAPSSEMTDVFMLEMSDGPRELTIGWAKAGISAWTTSMADTRLAPRGDYVRIARFREVEALKLQQVFAANLTRVGTLASPHAAAPVGLKLLAPTADGGHHPVMEIGASEAAAAVIQGKVRREVGGRTRDANEKRLVFGRDLADRIAAAAEAYEGPPLAEATAKNLLSLARSPEELLIFRESCEVGATLNVAHGFIISVAWHTDPIHERLKRKFVLSVIDPKDDELRSSKGARVNVRRPRDAAGGGH